MKCKFLFSILGAFSLAFLASCDNQSIVIDNNDNIEKNDNGSSNNTSDNGNNSSIYSSMDITYNTVNASSALTVEDTVDMVYDSVVAINVEGEGFTAAGSGVLFGYDEDYGLSYVVTCFHVIEDAYTIEIVLSDETTYSASYVGGYSDGDIAVLSIKALGLTYASIYDNSNNLRLGSTVICIGNPLGTLPGSVSTGVVSYVNRVVAVDDYSSMTLIQTDVAINSGNSGGGLFNSSGALIGIVNAKYSTTGVEGLGFAIPSNQVKDIIDSISDTAAYNTLTNYWTPGYVIGDYEYSFVVSDGYYSTGGWPQVTRKQVAYVSSVSDNTTSTGYNLLELDDIITSLTVDYKDETKADAVLSTVTSATINQILYSGDIELGDTITFVLTRNSSSMTVSFVVTQYIYSI